MSEASIHQWLCWVQIALAPITVIALLFVSAPYGRHQRSGWGPTIPVRWMWLVMESPASVGFIILFFLGRHRFEYVPLALLALWQLHYIHRTFIYPLRIRADGKRTPLSVALLGMSFQLLNSYINARHISHLGGYDESWLYDPRFLLGVTIFLVGRQINRDSDARLIALREKGDGYHIPEGGLFRFVSCPNYFGEVVEWLGWAIASWSLAGWAFAIYTAANLIPRAVSHHRWYRQKFRAYPRERKAVLPYLL